MTSTTETDVQAIQFNGLDDYLRIVGWMKDCGDTYALADEIRYTTPIMLLQTPEGTKAASPGDWIVRGADGRFSVASHGKAETVRTYRVQLIPGSPDGDCETFIDAESFNRTRESDHQRVVFSREGRTVAEVAVAAIVVIEEMQPLNPSEREELEELRETVAILDDPDAMADLAESMAQTRAAAELDRIRDNVAARKASLFTHPDKRHPADDLPTCPPECGEGHTYDGGCGQAGTLPARPMPPEHAYSA